MATAPDVRTERRFRHLVANSLVTQTIGAFIWWVYIFWAFLNTGSVLITGVVGAAYMIIVAVASPTFGVFVDRQGARRAMLSSSVIGTTLLAVAGLFVAAVDDDALLSMSNPLFWVFLVVLLSGSVATAMRGLALATTVSVLVRADRRDKANGIIGTANGVSFVVTSLFSGAAIGYLGVRWSFAVTVVVLGCATAHLWTVSFDDGAKRRSPSPTDETERAAPAAPHSTVSELRAAVAAVREVPGLWFLVALSAFNNLLGGVLMALLDAYGLTLVSAQAWGLTWAIISCGMIAGGLYVARVGLGPWPFRALMTTNLIGWCACSVFALQPSIVLLAVGVCVWLTVSPITEAAEQTILQRAIPHDRQGRVFGLAQFVEYAAAPVTSLGIAPIAQSVVIPSMTDGWGAEQIGSWFGTGTDRGMAVIFILSGVIGAVGTIAAWASPTARRFAVPPPEQVVA